MEVICSNCKRKINAENINVAKDTAICPSCEELTSLSTLIEATPSKSFDVHSPVGGTYIYDRGNNWAVRASHRSWIALFLVPFTLAWAGGSLSGIYGSLLAKGEFNPGQFLFGLPFLIGSIVLIVFCLMSLFGSTLVSVENGKGLIFMGIGSIGWYRRFEWKLVDRVTENTSGQYKCISLEGRRRLNLGWGLSEKKLYFLANFLRTKLQ